MDEFDLMKEQNRMSYDSQSDLQEQQADMQGKLVAPQLKQQIAEAQAAVIAQTNPARALKIILEGFRGKMENEYGDFEVVGQPLMNERGLARIASMLIPFINDPIRFGNISEKEVRDISLQVADDITEDIGLNWREYGIKDPSTKDLIIDALITLIFITLTRSEGQGEKNFLSKVILESLGGGKQTKKEDSGWKKYFKL
jgi:hypothetical protein